MNRARRKHRLPLLHLQGSAHVGTLAGSKTASGLVRFGKLTLSNGAALARRRSVGQGISPMPLSKVTFAGTGLRIDSEAATVQLYNSSGNPSGFGPSDDPEGVFYGRLDILSGDVWWPTGVPAGCTVTPLAGGSFTLAVGGGVTPGAYSFTWNLRRNTDGSRSTGTQGFHSDLMPTKRSLLNDILTKVNAIMATQSELQAQLDALGDQLTKPRPKFTLRSRRYRRQSRRRVIRRPKWMRHSRDCRRSPRNLDALNPDA